MLIFRGEGAVKRPLLYEVKKPDVYWAIHQHYLRQRLLGNTPALSMTTFTGQSPALSMTTFTGQYTSIIYDNIYWAIHLHYL